MIIEEENKNETFDKTNKSVNRSIPDRLVYDDLNHLNELVKEILSYHVNDGVDQFEQISHFIKKKMTKLSFQYIRQTKSQKKCVELTDYEQKIIVNLSMIEEKCY